MEENDIDLEIKRCRSLLDGEFAKIHMFFDKLRTLFNQNDPTPHQLLHEILNQGTIERQILDVQVFVSPSQGPFSETTSIDMFCILYFMVHCSTTIVSCYNSINKLEGESCKTPVKSATITAISDLMIFRKFIELLVCWGWYCFPIAPTGMALEKRSSNESVHLKIPNSIISWALRQKTTEDLNALFSFGELKSYFGGSPGKNWLICLVDALQAVTLCPDLQMATYERFLPDICCIMVVLHVVPESISLAFPQLVNFYPLIRILEEKGIFPLQCSSSDDQSLQSAQHLLQFFQNYPLAMLMGSFMRLLHQHLDGSVVFVPFGKDNSEGSIKDTPTQYTQHFFKCLRKSLSSVLSTCLMMSGGISGLMKTLLSDSDPSQDGSFNYIITLVMAYPKDFISEEEYCKAILPQLIEITLIQDQRALNYIRGSFAILCNFLATHSSQSLGYFLSHVAKPFVLIQCPCDELHNEGIVVSDKDFQTSISMLSTLACNLRSTLAKLLETIFPAILRLFFFVQGKPLGVVSSVNRLVEVACSVCPNAALIIQDFLKEKVQNRLILRNSDSGGVEAVYSIQNDCDEWHWEQSQIQELFQITRETNVPGKIVLFFLKLYSDSKHSASTEFISPHLLIRVLATLKESLENMADVIVRDVGQCIDCIRLILETIEKSGGMLQPETENEQVIAVSDTETIRPISKKDAQEMITICLGMLSAIFSIYGHTLDQSNARIAKGIIPVLKSCVTFADESVSELAKHVYQQLITQVKVHMIIEADEKLDFDQNISQNLESQTISDEINHRIRDAINDLRDPNPPIKAYGLTQLRYLLEEHADSAFMKEKLDDVMELMYKQLQDSDSYVYLCAIKGLRQSIQIWPHESIEMLTHRIKDTTQPENLRVNIGEILLHAARRCTFTIPNLTRMCANTFMLCARESSELIKASCLSNLAEIVQHSANNLCPLLFDLVLCCTTICNGESRAIVRRAAVFLGLKIIQGLGLASLLEFPDELRNLREFLQNRSNITIESDDIVRGHAQVGLGMISQVMRDFSNPSMDMMQSLRIDQDLLSLD